MKNKNTFIDAFVGIVLLDDQERIFLIKEDDKNKIGKDRWNLPGGSIDGDEGLIEAAEREIKEETGYKVKVESLLGCYRCKKRNNFWVYIVFEAKIIGKAGAQTDPGIKEGKWFDKNKFLHLGSDQIVHPDMQLVYSVAIEGGGLPTDSVKFIDYDVQ